MNNIAFEIGGWTIYWYGVLAAAGFLAAFWTASRRSVLDGLHKETVLDLAPWLILGALAGSRLWYVVSYWQQDFAQRPFWEIFLLRQGGLVWYGGLVGASFAVIIYCRIKRLPLWKIADVSAPSIALGHAFGRFGCLMNGCCYGHATSAPWAIHFPQGHEMYGIGVHPTQVYEAGLNIALYLGLAWLYRRKKFDGQIFALYLMGYAVLRSIVEIFRGDYPPGQLYFGGNLTPAHLISIGIMAAGLLLWWKLQEHSPRVQVQKP